MEYLILVNAVFENGTHTGNDVSDEEVFEIDLAEWRNDDVKDNFQKVDPCMSV